MLNKRKAYNLGELIRFETFSDEDKVIQIAAHLTEKKTCWGKSFDD